MRIHSIAEKILNNVEISSAEVEYLKNNLMNEDNLSTFDTLYKTIPEKIPSISLAYMKNPKSIEQFKKYINQFELNYIGNKKLPPIVRFSKGIMKNKLIPADQKAVLVLFSKVSYYNIQNYEKEVIDETINLQTKYKNEKIDEKIILIIKEGLIQNKLSTQSLENIIPIIVDQNLKDHLIDIFLTTLDQNFSKISGSLSNYSLEDCYKMIDKLKRQYDSKNIFSNHHMVLQKKGRLTKLHDSLKKSIMNELSGRKDCLLTYLIL